MMYPRVERYRDAVRAVTFCPMSALEIAELRRFYYSEHFSDMIGERPSPEVFALLDMFLSERVPPDVSERFILRYVCEEVVRRGLGSSGNTIQ